MSAANPGEINLFQILHQERTTYGLRSGDYARYHKHLSSRLSKLRAALGTQHKTKKSDTFNKVVPVKGEDIKDARSLELVLLEAERAHTTSLALHQTYLSAPAATRHTSTLHNSHTRSNKSLAHASNLITLLDTLPAQTPASARSLGQAKIYHLVLQAGLAFKKEDYESALPAYIVARSLLAELAQGEDTPRGEALALGWMDDEVDPRIRFCAYKLGRKDSHDVPGIVAEFDGDELVELLTEYDATAMSEALKAWAGQDGKESKKDGKKVVWLEKEIEFRNADVVVVMEKVEKALAKLDGTAGAGGKKMRAYDRVLGELGEAYEKVKRIRSEGQASSSTSSAPAAGQSDSLALLQDYLLHSLLSNRIARDLSLVKVLLRPFPTTPTTAAKPSSSSADLLKVLPSVIKLYDGIIKGWEAIRELGAVEADGDVSEAVEGKVGFFRAKRIYHLSQLHLLLPPAVTSSTDTSTATPTQKAALLLSRSSLLLRQLLHAPRTYPSDLNPLDEERDIQALERDVEVLEGQAKRTLYRETVGAGKGGAEQEVKDLARGYISLRRTEETQGKGKGKQPSAPVAGAAGGVLATAKKGVEQVKAAVVGATAPAESSSDDDEEEHFEEAAEGEDTSSEEEQEEETKKGWLGGWFGRK